MKHLPKWRALTPFLGLGLVFSQVAFLTPLQAVPEASQVLVTGVERQSAKRLDCETLGITGFVANLEGTARIPGVLCTLTYLSDDGVGDINYYDHISYAPGPLPQNPNGGTESHAVTDASGEFQVVVEVCPNDPFWEANFQICATLVGYQEQCLEVDFDFDTNNRQRFFNLAAAEQPTATPSPVPEATPTATPGATEFAAHPEFDANGDGLIGAADLLLFMADWMKPVQMN